MATTIKRLRDFKAGQVWWIDEPIRVVRIVGFDSVTVPNKTQPDQPFEKQCVIAEGTIPDCEIPGFLKAEDVPMYRTIKASSGDTIWREIYAERYVPAVIQDTKSKAAQLDDRPGHMVLQVYCLAEEERAERATRTSPLANRPISGRLIPVADVPINLFGKVEDAPLGVAELVRAQNPTGNTIPAGTPMVYDKAASEATGKPVCVPAPDGPLTIGDKYPKSFLGLSRLALDRGLDISDIHGPGSRNKLIARLEEQEQTDAKESGTSNAQDGAEARV